ncbi:MAG: CoA transferase subunit A [Candidatus Tectomicrobia bacterium]|uniref:CoA transferase subunit A n=1 Tax=Tectimicrobiota bacterium TaxID=2528274 RepID=A0A933GL63_UNCTE|nr:CoA transferase subunit A [Candidatus Tectomicrobia bacterium]
MDLLMEGKGQFPPPDPDAHRLWNREKSRALVNKVMSEKEAVAKFVRDNDYLIWDQNDLVSGPNSLLREIIRQRRKNLWVANKFTYCYTTLLYGAGCLGKLDVGFFPMGGIIKKAAEEGKIQTIEWTNWMLVLRLLAGAMGLPFLPTRTLMGTDNLTFSGAKVVKDPFTGQNICLVPALNPDVAIIHVNECDIYGNARIYNPRCSPLESVMASKKVIVSTEEIIDHEEVRRTPSKTSIPFYFVDAVVEAPFGAYPGTMPGLYRHDSDGIGAIFKSAASEEAMQVYLTDTCYSVESHEEFLDKRVGVKKLLEIKRGEEIREGYYL